MSSLYILVINTLLVVSLKYDLNQIPYDYAVEVRNKFKGLGLIEYLKNYGEKPKAKEKRKDIPFECRIAKNYLPCQGR